MSLHKEIRDIISVHIWKFDGLPDEIISAFDRLLPIYKRDEIIAAMHSIAPDLKKSEAEARECRGNSGIAGEHHMAIQMQLAYLNQALEMLQENSAEV